jgi:hypothetical protein
VRHAGLARQLDRDASGGELLGKALARRSEIVELGVLDVGG